MSGEQQAPAAWYDDGLGAKRWWDGQRWTEWVYDPAFGGNGVRAQPLRAPEPAGDTAAAADASASTGATPATTAEASPDEAAPARVGADTTSAPAATADVGAGTSASDYRCPYCRRTGTLGSRGECRSCGAHARVQDLVSDSGWEELPGAEDMAHIQIGRSSVQIAGNFVPIAEVTLVDGDVVWFPHHKLTYADERVAITKHNDGKGFFTRIASGMPMSLLAARGPGRIALSDNHMGEVVALPIDDGGGYWVRDHVFVAATPTVTYRPHQNGLWVKFRKDKANGETEYETEYPLGQYDDLFYAQGGPGLLLLHSPGNTMFRDLGAGDTIRIPPQALLYRDLSVTPYLVAEYPSTAGWRSWFGSGNYENRHLWLSLTGPGRVAISSKYEKEHSHPYPIVNGTVHFHRW